MLACSKHVHQHFECLVKRKRGKEKKGNEDRCKQKPHGESIVVSIQILDIISLIKNIPYIKTQEKSHTLSSLKEMFS